MGEFLTSLVTSFNGMSSKTLKAGYFRFNQPEPCSGLVSKHTEPRLNKYDLCLIQQFGV